MKTLQSIVSVALVSLVLCGCEGGNEGGVMPQGTPPPTAEADANAKTLLEQLNQHILDKNWSGADSVMSQLEGMKGTVDPSVTADIETAKAALAAAKAG